MQTLKKKIKILIITTGIILTRVQFSAAFDPSADQMTNFWSGALLHYQAQTPHKLSPSKKDIVKNFCTTSLSPQMSSIFNGTEDWYMSQQSIFLYLLCTHGGLINTNTFHPTISTTSQGYLKDITLKTFKVEKACLSEYTATCNLANIAEILIQAIISELTTLKHANIYGVLNESFTNDKQLEETIDIFSKEVLNINNNKEPFCTGKTHSYPATCKILKNNLKAFQKAFSKFTIIDSQKLLTNASDKINAPKYCEKDPKNPQKYDMLFCNIFGIQAKNKGLHFFTTTVYNEILWYSLFAGYYKHHLKLLTSPNEQDHLEYSIIANTPNTIISLTDQTLLQLNNILTTYPFHIGMLAYQEDLLRLRDRYLSKILPPFYTLYYKLQDVQIQK